MRVVDFFCGAGGMSCGLYQAGMKPVAGFDISEAALAVYAQNLWVDHGRMGSISDFAKIVPQLLRLKPTLIAGGPPCQDFSAAGQRTEGERADRTRDFAYAIALVQPEWFIFENVKEAPDSNSYRDARIVWKAHGYGLTEVQLDASYYIVPQRRKRFFCIGRKHEVDGFLEQDILAAASARPMTLKEAFGDRVADAIYVYPRSLERRRLWETSEPGPTVRSTYARGKPKHYKGHPKDARGEVTYLDRQMVADIQGFPPEWDWSGQKAADVNLMIANAVPPPLARALGQVIMARHNGKSARPMAEGFPEYLAAQGLEDAPVRNVLARLKRARNLLNGRDYADIELAVREIEKAPEFERLGTKQRSDLCSALRLYAEFTRKPDGPRESPSAMWTRLRMEKRALSPPGYMARIRPGYQPHARKITLDGGSGWRPDDIDQDDVAMREREDG